MEPLENWNVWPDKTAEVVAAAPVVRNSANFEFFVRDWRV